ncbi:MAG TPA: protein-L-isoaspartate O-methyltransferase [Steroidobacteraceae bacterium]|jgi:protein-L-isoaspartate(D-aspartate) O-methyltransferase|nr:protein-L-isoaspartate O-methyltransferase [Steroidobacteraceae bacterium]
MLMEAAREQMVEQQVRASDVLDERILNTLRAVPRQRFVPQPWHELAFADCEIALPCGKRMLRPMLVGRILQALALQGGEEVLEIGTGSGYLSACLAGLGGRVRSLELHPQIADFARANLGAAAPGLPIEVIGADAMQLAEESRYDVIVLTASLPIYQARFERALRPDGRMFVVVGATTLQEASLVRRVGAGGCNSESLFETCIEPLEHAPRPPSFGF